MDRGKIIIAGAGIAGLSAALALSACGFNISIFEQTEVLSEQGAGIQLGPNATSILRHWNLEDALLCRSFMPETIDLKDGKTNKNLVCLPVKRFANHYWHAPYVTIHRGDLQDILQKAIEKNPHISLQCGTKVTSVAGAIETGFIVEVATQKGIERQNCCLFLACDGVWSPLRRQEKFFPQRRSKAQFSNFIAWRTTIAQKGWPSVLGQKSNVTAFMGSNSHLICYPIRQGQEFNLVAITNHQMPGDSPSQPVDKQKMVHPFHQWHADLAQFISTIEDWTYWPIFTMPSPCFLSSSDVLFLGDSAHGAPPFAAQGAAMAIEDAARLAHFLPSPASLSRTNLENFAKERTVRVRKVSRRGAFNRFVYHADGLVAKARNTYMKNREGGKFLHDLAWLYQYQAYTI